MNIFQYLIFLGIVQLVYSFIFHWLSLLLALLLVALRMDKWGAYIVKTLNYYLYISILVLLTLVALQGNTSFIYGLLVGILGLFFAYITIAGGMYEGYKQARENLALEALAGMKYDSYFLIASLGYFIFALFVPIVASTLPVKFILQAIGWIYELPIIGFLLGVGGLFSMLGTFSQALIIGAVGIGALIGKLKGNKQEISKDTVDPLINEAVELMTKHETVSASFFQRSLAISFDRAQEIENTLVKYGLISHTDYDGIRKVLITDSTEINNIKHMLNSLPKYDTSRFSEEKVEPLERDDDLYSGVKAYTLTQEIISPAKLQKTFGIGYARSCALLDKLYKEGIIDEGNNKTHKVLKTE